jgi:hypothetical protein
MYSRHPPCLRDGSTFPRETQPTERHGRRVVRHQPKVLPVVSCQNLGETEDQGIDLEGAEV